LLDTGWVIEQTPRSYNNSNNDEAREIGDGVGTRRN
jgi:hypothetical protein